MNRIIVLLFSIVLFSVFCLLGCSSSEETTSGQEEKTVVSPKDTVETALKPEIKKEEKTDTLNIMDAQKTQKPPYQPAEVSKPLESEAFECDYAVQVGAFKNKESAERFADISKERFPGRVLITTDENDMMFKVLIGYFKVKEEARVFRDELNQKYPAEYKDAWVTEIKKK